MKTNTCEITFRKSAKSFSPNLCFPKVFFTKTFARYSVKKKFLWCGTLTVFFLCLL